MKKTLISIVVLFTTISCGGSSESSGVEVVNSEAIELSLKNDSLQSEILLRDSIMNDALFTISDISATLSAIKTKEGVLMKDVEVGKSTKEQIKEDLDILSNILDEKTVSFNALRGAMAKLTDANIEIEGLQNLVNQLERELRERNETINLLKANINNLKEQVKELNEDLELMTSENELLKATIIENVEDMNRGYYITGEVKELVESGILIQKGTIVRSYEINPDLDMSKLVQIDIRNLDKLDIKGRDIKVIGKFATNTYTLIDGREKKSVESIIIDDKEEFWRDSKVLVITYKR
ncbi:MAG: hypothetical protein R3Y50_10440 [Rikenellaceae bacterium]